MTNEEMKEALTNPKVSEAFGTSGLLVATLLTNSALETDKIRDFLIESEFRVGWDAGYEVGYALGAAAVQRDMQRAMGLPVSVEHLRGLDEKERMRDEDIQFRIKERGKR